MKIELLEDLYKQKLAELFDAEKQLVRFLPKMAKATANDELRELLEKHAEETKVQCERLEKLIATRGVAEARKSKAMSGLLAESRELMQQEKSADPEVLTLALASAAQDVEGHEIAGYACAHMYARMLGFHSDLKPLEATFEEENKMEERLLTLADRLGIEQAEAETPDERTEAKAQ